MTFSIVTLSIRSFYVTLSISDIQHKLNMHNNALPLCKASLCWLSPFIYYLSGATRGGSWQARLAPGKLCLAGRSVGPCRPVNIYANPVDELKLSTSFQFTSFCRWVDIRPIGLLTRWCSTSHPRTAVGAKNLVTLRQQLLFVIALPC
jgi:hypothetical protein